MNNSMIVVIYLIDRDNFVFFSTSKQKIIKQVKKLKDTPDMEKPMRYGRKGTRELYISPYRLSYFYIPKENKLLLLDVYHKDEQ